MNPNQRRYRTPGERQAAEAFERRALPGLVATLSARLAMAPEGVAFLLREAWDRLELLAPPDDWALEKLSARVARDVEQGEILAALDRQRVEAMFIAQEDDNARAIRVLCGRAPLRAPLPPQPRATCARSGLRDRTTTLALRR